MSLEEGFQFDGHLSSGQSAGLPGAARNVCGSSMFGQEIESSRLQLPEKKQMRAGRVPEELTLGLLCFSRA